MGGGRGVEPVEVGLVGRRPHDGAGDGPSARVVERAVDPGPGRGAGEVGGLGGVEAAEEAEQAGALVHVADEHVERPADPPVDEQAGPALARAAPVGRDAQAAQHADAGAALVDRVRAEVEREAVAGAGAGPAAEVGGTLEDRDRAAGAGEDGAGGEAGEAAADDERAGGSVDVHAFQTIERAGL